MRVALLSYRRQQSMILLNTDNLKAVMKREKLTQKELADKLRMSRACVNRHLSGTRKYPSAKFIGAIKESFPEYSFDYFFTFSVTKK
jgi:transcriptional regulator with XRE-family HTH domain